MIAMKETKYAFKEGDKIKIPKAKSTGGSYKDFLDELHSNKPTPEYLFIRSISGNSFCDVGVTPDTMMGYSSFKLSEIEPYEDPTNPIHNYNLI
jgi:hypothetical protein